MVLALLQAKDVRHAALAARFSGRAQTNSVIRRVDRFFDRHPLCPADVARVVLALLPQTRPREFIIDRTNWRYG
ncbi:transposase, partial [Deinococcus arcticus]